MVTTFIKFTDQLVIVRTAKLPIRNSRGTCCYHLEMKTVLLFNNNDYFLNLLDTTMRDVLI